MKTDQSSFGLGQMLGTPAGRQDEQAGQGKPQEGDVSRFEDLLGEQKVAEAQPPAAMPIPAAFTFSAPGDAMLRGMAAGGAAPDNQAIGRLIDGIASRVLVGDGSAGGREVRIEIGEEVFPGLEIRIFEEGGRLVVAFATANANDLALLRTRSSELATRLKERAGRDVELRFTRREDGGDSGEGGPGA